MGEVIFAVAFIGSIIGWTFLINKKLPKWLWFATMAGCTALVIGMEIGSVAGTGKTLSQHYWKWSLENEFKSWLAVGSMVLGWGIFMVHLQWKLLRKRFDPKDE